MKTLRLLRNIAALFIFGAALLVPRPAVGLGGCLPSTGFNCTKGGGPGGCTESPCTAGQPCNNQGCFHICAFFHCK